MCSGITIGIRGAVSALQPDLVRQPSLGPRQKKFRIEGDAAVRIGIELYHPAVEAVLIELRIDRAIERVAEIDAASVAANLDHLRAASQSPVFRTGVTGARDDATN